MSVLGVGIDAVETARVEELLGSHPERFLDRCFRPGDAAREPAKQGGVDPGKVALAWAAKEALLKALAGDVRRLPYRDIECVRGPAGGFELRLYGEVAGRAKARGVARCHLEVASAAENTVATVLLESPD